MTPTEAATKWGVTRQHVLSLCRAGRVAGAVLSADAGGVGSGRGLWWIPDDAEFTSIVKKRPGPQKGSRYRKKRVQGIITDSLKLFGVLLPGGNSDESK